MSYCKIFHHPPADIMWPSPNPLWRSSAGPTPVLQGHATHFSSWTSSTTSTPPTFSFPGQHAPALHPRDLPQPPPDVHQYAAPTLPPHLGFGLPQAEPPVSALTQATQMFSEVLNKFLTRPAPFPPSTSPPEPLPTFPATQSPSAPTL